MFFTSQQLSFFVFCFHVIRLCFSVLMFMTQYFRWTAGVLSGPQLNGWRRKWPMLRIRHGVSNWYWNNQWVKTVQRYRNWFRSHSVDFRWLRARDCNILWLLLHRYFRYLIHYQNTFSVLSLNTQGIDAKFDNIYAIVNNLSSLGDYFGAICLQETWLRNDADISLFSILDYRLIHQGSKCTKHGGLIIYLNERYSYKLRNLYVGSGIREGLFVDVTGYNLRRSLTTGNIYRHPHDNKSNENIDIFLKELFLNFDQGEY